MTIHLKHTCNIPVKAVDPIGWLYLAKRRTLCWTHITEAMEVTNDKSKVTCKRCIKKMGEHHGE